MNKIIDRSGTDSGATQPQPPVVDGETPDNGEYHNDSIVTYRTENQIGSDETCANQNAVEQPDSAVPSQPKDTPLDAYRYASAALLVAIISLSAAGGYVLGQGNRLGNMQPAMAMAGMSGTSFVNNVDAGLSEPLLIADVQAQAVLVQTEITGQLGEMRAELLRLHTVFVRLAELAQLDDGEFDLESPLLDWKEQSSLSKIGLLNRRIAHMSGNSSKLTSIFDLRRMAFDQKISGRPIVEGYRTSGFGYRTDPITGKRDEHLGLDYSGPVGEPILALADGIVTFSGKNSGYGNLVELEHVGGLRTRYAHNQANLVNRGVRVKKGEAIATLGSTGRSTGPHVHVEVRLDGTPIDPGFFIR